MRTDGHFPPISLSFYALRVFENTNKNKSNIALMKGVNPLTLQVAATALLIKHSEYI
jgi:hypothetical protein